VDCALAELTSAGISGLGPLQNVAVADPVTRLTNVRKTGRTTGLTHSTISTWGWRGYIDFSFGTYEFGDLMGAYLLRAVGPGSPRQDTFAAPGDSGSLVLIDDPAKKGLGLVMARAFCSSVFQPKAPPPAWRILPSGAFVGYHVLLCSLKTVQNKLQALPGLGPTTFSVDT